MPAAFEYRRLLVLVSLVMYGGVFLAFLQFEVPGLGLGHFFYLAVGLLALTGGPVRGVAAGFLADALYALGIVLNPAIPYAEIASANTVIRLATYAAMGALIGWFAADNRRLVQQLRILAERDFLTGLPNTRAFESAIARRFEDGTPFALLLGDMDGLKGINDSRGHAEGNDALRRLADALGSALGAADEVARVGGDEFALLVSARSTTDAARLATRLEAQLAERVASITFGWAFYPVEGTNALSLYRAADERLYARKIVRTERRDRDGVVIPFAR